MSLLWYHTRLGTRGLSSGLAACKPTADLLCLRSVLDDGLLDFSELKANDCGLPATGYGSVPDLGELESALCGSGRVSSSVRVVTLNLRPKVGRSVGPSSKFCIMLSLVEHVR